MHARGQFASWRRQANPSPALVPPLGSIRQISAVCGCPAHGARPSPALPFGTGGIMFFEMLAVTTSLRRFLQVLLLMLAVALGATATAQAASLAVAPEGALKQHMPALEDAPDCASCGEGVVAEATCNSFSGCPLHGVLTNASPFEPDCGALSLVLAGWSSGSISIDPVTKPPRRTVAA